MIDDWGNYIKAHFKTCIAILLLFINTLCCSFPLKWKEKNLDETLKMFFEFKNIFKICKFNLKKSKSAYIDPPHFSSLLVSVPL